MIHQPNIELRHISAFIAVAETLSFRKAAERLYMTQPGLTRIIKRLEEDIEVSLFTRTTRTVKLTDAGKVFLTEILVAEEKIRIAIDKAQNAAEGNTGYLKVAYNGFAINHPLPTALRNLHRAHSGIRTDLIYLPSEDQKKKLLDSEIDIGFMIGKINNPEIEHLLISREQLVVVLPEDHELAKCDKIFCDMLASESFILGSQKDWGSFLPIVFDLCHQANFHPKIRQHVDTSEGILGMVAAGLGITLFQESALKVRKTGLAIRPLDHKTNTVETFAVWLKSNPSPSLRKFQHILEDLYPHD